MFFKRRFTKWLPILIYDFSGNKFLLQGRKNLKTGELCFKNTLMNGRWNLMHNMPQNIFDPKEQLQRLLTYSDSI
jgi:hypothetical protein